MLLIKAITLKPNYEYINFTLVKKCVLHVHVLLWGYENRGFTQETLTRTSGIVYLNLIRINATSDHVLDVINKAVSTAEAIMSNEM